MLYILSTFTLCKYTIFLSYLLPERDGFTEKQYLKLDFHFVFISHPTSELVPYLMTPAPPKIKLQK